MQHPTAIRDVHDGMADGHSLDGRPSLVYLPHPEVAAIAARRARAREIGRAPGRQRHPTDMFRRDRTFTEIHDVRRTDTTAISASMSPFARWSV